MKKKAFLAAFVFILAVAIFAGCQNSGKNKNPGGSADDSDVKIVEIETRLTQEYFVNNKLTILNVWATWCPPCVAELPELQKVSDAYKDKGVEIIGILQDGIKEPGMPDESIVDAANILMRNAGASYRIILPDEYLISEFISTMQYFPTTFFLDSSGTVVKTVIGANEFESWGTMINEVLDAFETIED